MPGQWFGTGLQASGEWNSLVRRVEQIEKRLGPVSTLAFAQQEKRYRLAAVDIGVVVGQGERATVDVGWTTPFTTIDYKVDVAVSSSVGQPVSDIQVDNRTETGCTVSFIVTGRVSVGTLVIVLAISGQKS